MRIPQPRGGTRRGAEHHNYSPRRLAEQSCDIQFALGECRESDAVVLRLFIIARFDATNSRTHPSSGEPVLRPTWWSSWRWSPSRWRYLEGPHGRFEDRISHSQLFRLF